MLIDACVLIESGELVETQAGRLVALMDRAGIDKAVLHPPSVGYAWENEKYNKAFLCCAETFDSRFIASATVNPWRPDAVEVIMDSVSAGAGLLSFAPDTQGFNVSGRKLDGILEMLVENNLRLPVYVHTGHYGFSAVSQVFIAATRFPAINFILGHSGATDYGTDIVPVIKSSENIYFESSFARPPGFAAKVGMLGSAKALMGSGFPLNDMEFEWSEMRRLVPQQFHDDLFGGSLLKLLGEGL